MRIRSNRINELNWHQYKIKLNSYVNKFERNNKERDYKELFEEEKERERETDEEKIKGEYPW